MIERVQRLAQNPNVRQFLTFAIVGATATLFQYLILAGLVELAHAPEVPASIFAYACGGITTYVLNRRYTFQSQSDVKRTFPKFLLVNGSGLGVNTAIFAALTHWGWHYMLAQGLATGLVVIWNYVGARLFVYK